MCYTKIKLHFFIGSKMRLVNCCTSATTLVGIRSLCKFSVFFFFICGAFGGVVSIAVMPSFKSLTETLINTFY